MKIVLLLLVCCLTTTVIGFPSEVLVQQARGLTDIVKDAFGLGEVWSTITKLGKEVADNLVNVLTQVLFAGKQVFNAGLVIVKQLVEDLKNHAEDGLKYVTQAIADLKNLVDSTKPGKRDVEMIGSRGGPFDTIIKIFGLDQVWDTLTSITQQVFDNLIKVLTKLMFAGKQVFDAGMVIVQKMISDLINHVGDATQIVQGAIDQLNSLLNTKPGKRDVEMIGSRGGWDGIKDFFGLGAVWKTISDLGNVITTQFIAVVTQIFFAGTQVINQAKPILDKLISDLTNHVGDAATIVKASIVQLQGILPTKPGKRDVEMIGSRGFTDFILASFGLDKVWNKIQELGTSIKDQFLAVVTQIFFAGKQTIKQAKPILDQLISDLTNHVGDAKTIVETAINQLTGILKQGKPF